MQKPFTPITLNGISTSQEYQNKTSRESYESLCSDLNSMKFGLEELLTDLKDTDPQLTLDFLKAEDPLKFIKLKFVEAKKIHVPGLKPSAFLDGDMLDIPAEPLQQVLASRTAFDLAHAKACEKFDYPIKDLYIVEDDCGMFAVGESFDKALSEYYAETTSNEFENKIVEAMDNFVQSINDLIELGVLYPDARWRNQVLFIFQDKHVPLNRRSDRPLSLSRWAIEIARPFAIRLFEKQNIIETDQADTANQSEELEES